MPRRKRDKSHPQRMKPPVSFPGGLYAKPTPGAGEGTRTPAIQLGKLTFYH